MASGAGSRQRIRQAATAALAIVEDVSRRTTPFAPEVWLFDDSLRKADVDADSSRSLCFFCIHAAMHSCINHASAWVGMVCS
jgi:hypothetical protein